MRRTLAVVFSIVLATGAISCRRRRTPVVAPATDADFASERLRDHIRANRRSVLVEHRNGEIIWSDRAILEHSASLPAAIVQLVAEPANESNGLARPDAMAAFLDDVSARRGQWQLGVYRRVSGSSSSCEVANGVVTASVNCVYGDYLTARYPRAGFLVRAADDSVLIEDGGVIRGALMPLRPRGQ